jgi:hypothetical protein
MGVVGVVDPDWVVVAVDGIDPLAGVGVVAFAICVFHVVVRCTDNLAAPNRWV